jgi:hypothetical protein
VINVLKRFAFLTVASVFVLSGCSDAAPASDSQSLSGDVSESLTLDSLAAGTAEALLPADATASEPGAEADAVSEVPREDGEVSLTLPPGRFGVGSAEASSCLDRRTTELRAAAADTTGGRRHPGESAANALRHGWYPEMPAFIDGSILPCARIVAYYGNPNSTRMGVLARYPKDEMMRKLRAQVADWRAADPGTPVIPALHMVAVVASDQPGPSGRYRNIMRDRDVKKVLQWAREVDGVFFVDIQVGTDDIRNILPRFEWVLREPDVHLGIDPEFMMKDGSRPGTRIGTMDAADINYASEWLAKLVREHDLPPKVFVVHRFTQRMVTNHERIRLRPEVQLVMHMDGWGEARLKRDTWNYFVVREPVQYTGFKIFYDHDARGGNPVMSPRDMLRLQPAPLYIQYQ